MMVPIIAFDLPLPPSANNLYGTAKGRMGRFKTKAYAAWIEDAGKIVRDHHAAMGMPVFAKGYTITLRAGMTRQRDLDNTIKPVSDLLVRAIEGMPDDRWCDRIEMDREGPMGRVIVMVIGGGL